MFIYSRQKRQQSRRRVHFCNGARNSQIKFQPKERFGKSRSVYKLLPLYWCGTWIWPHMLECTTRSNIDLITLLRSASYALQFKVITILWCSRRWSSIEDRKRCNGRFILLRYEANLGSISSIVSKNLYYFTMIIDSIQNFFFCWVSLLYRRTTMCEARERSIWPVGVKRFSSYAARVKREDHHRLDWAGRLHKLYGFTRFYSLSNLCGYETRFTQ